MRRFSGWLFFLFVACSGAQSAPAVDPPEPVPTIVPPASSIPGNPLEASARDALFACWLQNPGTYFLDRFRADRTITIGDRSFGLFQSGIITMVYSHGAFVDCVRGGPSEGFADNFFAPLQNLSGLLVHVVQLGDEHPFDRINPEIVQWGVANLLPEADATILGVPFQEIYPSVFSQFFRNMTESYLNLINTSRLEGILAEYSALIERGDDALPWLDQFRLPGYPNYEDHPLDWAASYSAGFWLRRTMDGTADALWTGLREVMRRFDARWYESMRDRYTSSHIDW